MNRLYSLSCKKKIIPKTKYFSPDDITILKWLAGFTFLFTSYHIWAFYYNPMYILIINDDDDE